MKYPIGKKLVGQHFSRRKLSGPYQITVLIIVEGKHLFKKYTILKSGH